jgi:PPM family protein phosphatase
LLIKSSGITDVGLKRENNEDSFSVDEELGLFILADGMGGHRAGEKASRTAVDLIHKSFRDWTASGATEEMLFGEPDRALSIKGNYILSGIRLANKVIFELSSECKEYRGMGTTIAVLAVTPELVVAANVGDSRIYMIRDGELERLSKDHTIVAEHLEMGIISPKEARNSSLKHVLTRNLGSSEQLDPEVFEIGPANRDRFFLCSDGVTDLISDEDILKLFQEETEPVPLCRRFVDEALKRGGHDNTTVVSVFLTGIEESKQGLGGKMGGIMADCLASIHKTIRRFKP